MKIITAPASPYGRKVRVVILETGLEDRVEVEIIRVDQIGARASEHNPLGKIPVLVRDGALFDSPIFDSNVIAEYLDGLHDGPKLFPADGEARWTALRQQAVGGGIGEAVGLICGELARPDGARSETVLALQLEKLDRTLDALDSDIDALSDPLTIGPIAIACGLGYADFRMPDTDWRAGRHGLADWFDGFATRPSMTATFYRRPSPP